MNLRRKEKTVVNFKSFKSTRQYNPTGNPPVRRNTHRQKSSEDPGILIIEINPNNLESTNPQIVQQEIDKYINAIKKVKNQRNHYYGVEFYANSQQLPFASYINSDKRKKLSNLVNQNRLPTLTPHQATLNHQKLIDNLKKKFRTAIDPSVDKKCCFVASAKPKILAETFPLSKICKVTSRSSIPLVHYNKVVAKWNTDGTLKLEPVTREFRLPIKPILANSESNHLDQFHILDENGNTIVSTRFNTNQVVQDVTLNSTIVREAKNNNEKNKYTVYKHLRSDCIKLNSKSTLKSITNEHTMVEQVRSGTHRGEKIFYANVEGQNKTKVAVFKNNKLVVFDLANFDVIPKSDRLKAKKIEFYDNTANLRYKADAKRGVFAYYSKPTNQCKVTKPITHKGQSSLRKHFPNSLHFRQGVTPRPQGANQSALTANSIFSTSLTQQLRQTADALKGHQEKIKELRKQLNNPKLNLSQNEIARINIEIRLYSELADNSINRRDSIQRKMQ